MDADFELECSDCGTLYSADEPSCPHCNPQSKAKETKTSAKEENDIARGTRTATGEKGKPLFGDPLFAHGRWQAIGLMLVPLAVCAVIFFFVGRGCESSGDKTINVSYGGTTTGIKLNECKWEKKRGIWYGTHPAGGLYRPADADGAEAIEKHVARLNRKFPAMGLILFVGIAIIVAVIVLRFPKPWWENNRSTASLCLKVYFLALVIVFLILMLNYGIPLSSNAVAQLLGPSIFYAFFVVAGWGLLLLILNKDPAKEREKELPSPEGRESQKLGETNVERINSEYDEEKKRRS